ncbi:MAG: hypothetical protein A2X60_16375 [Ignavibacteria bacterium GWF2_35_20]|nr:MAG: hypothetical protein A2X60_16375 [Ignavibacteria bacterium GWF2_35_20]
MPHKYSSHSTKDIIKLLDKRIKREMDHSVISFDEFLRLLSNEPFLILRNVFQLFADMIYFYIDEEDEYENDPESINYKTIRCEKLLVQGTDIPFFADLPLANRLVRLAESFREGSQQNKIYIFMGPPGSGKSTFITNLLQKFQQFTYTPQGAYYEIVWRLDSSKLGPDFAPEIKAALEEYYKMSSPSAPPKSSYFEVPCPCHDHPFLLIPKNYRIEILEKLLSDESKSKIFHKKEYDWVFKNSLCTICNSIYSALADRITSPSDIFNMAFVKRYYFDRSLGNGISVYNPGDRDPDKTFYTNEVLQNELGIKFMNSNLVKYIYSRYAKTNNGVYVIMDVKGFNENRFVGLHGIISEGTYKIDDIEENVDSLFMAVMNPEDEEKLDIQESFKDRIKKINVNYILNYNEEVKIYYNAFGEQIKNRFLPGVLDNFGKIIISSRMNQKSEAMAGWITERKKYIKYCDEDLLLLKLSIYNNKIPSWLSAEDYKIFDRKLRRTIIGESEFEGRSGFSGRESLSIFNEFYNFVRKRYYDIDEQKKDILITMLDIKEFFSKHKNYLDKIPSGFIDSVIRLYDYDVMQQIKESLFHQNVERISKDIQNYLFAANYDLGEKITSPYTNEVIEVSENFFVAIEQNLFSKKISEKERKAFREETAKKFITTLQEMHVTESGIEETQVYKDIYNTYIRNLRENIFQPFTEYTSFESAIKEFGTPKFEVYDNKTKEQVNFLIANLTTKFTYTVEGAKQICLYILTNKIAEKFHS